MILNADRPKVRDYIQRQQVGEDYQRQNSPLQTSSDLVLADVSLAGRDPTEHSHSIAQNKNLVL